MGTEDPPARDTEIDRLVKYAGCVLAVVLGTYGVDRWVEAKIEDKVDPLEQQIESLDRSKNAQYGIIRSDIQTLCDAIEDCEMDR